MRRPRLAAALQAHSSRYNVMSLDIIWNAEFAADGWIMPISPQRFPLAGFSQPGVAAVRSSGRRYAVPFPSSAGPLRYRGEAVARLTFLPGGLREGWIPRGALNSEEAAFQRAFEAGKLLFLRNWPYVHGPASTPGPGNKVAGKFAATALPGPRGPGLRVLGGANLAVSAFSKHQRTALAPIKFLTSLASEWKVLEDGSLPPSFTCVHRALATGRPAAATIAALPGELKSILQNGDNPYGPPPKITKVWEEIQHDRSETAGPGTAGLAGSGSHAGARCVRRLIVERA